MDARLAAEACSSLEALRSALEAFEGCDLKKYANSLVFGAGAVGAPVMLIGDAPDAGEDRAGTPFVADAGLLLDRMLAAIGLSRETVYLANSVYWRPAGNRSPNESEIAICRPFLEKQIALVAPRLLLLAGGQAVTSLVGGKQGITRSRGKWYDVQIAGQTIPTLATFHPAYLLKTPVAKRQAWHDLLTLQRRMQELGIIPQG